MGCLNVEVKCLNVPISVGIFKLKSIEADAYKSTKDLFATSYKATRDLIVYCGLVCSSVSGEHYLRVEPNTLWLTPDAFNGVDFDIYSNVIWNIE